MSGSEALFFNMKENRGINMDEIRQLAEQDWEESLLLSEFAFQYTLTDEAKEKVKRFVALDRQWGFFTEGKLAAKMNILPLEAWISGKRYAMGGIASVATWPEYRRKGMVGRLIHNALEVMKQEGHTVSLLHPFSHAFYRRYGWEQCIDYKKYEIPVQMLKMTDAAKTTHKRVVRYSRTSMPLLHKLYEQYASQYNGMLSRYDDWWELRVFDRKPGQIGVLTDEQGDQAEGYILYEVKDRVMNVHELVYLNESARQGLWAFIANHDSMIDKVTLTAPANDHLPFYLANPRVKQELIPYFMARIVDVEGFLRQYPFKASDREETVIMHVQDEHAAWNQGSFLLEISMDGSAAVERLTSSQVADSSRQISCDIQALTTMMFGYVRAPWLQAAGRLHGDPETAERLDRRIDGRIPYLADFF
jgi:predicted acetyltransferase